MSNKWPIRGLATLVSAGWIPADTPFDTDGGEKRKGNVELRRLIAELL
jgi:hypothetical protein